MNNSGQAALDRADGDEMAVLSSRLLQKPAFQATFISMH